MKMTRKQIEARLYELFGRSTTLRHYPAAPIGADKTKRLDRLREIRTRIAALETEIDRMHQNEPWKLLLEAARFAVDVDGDEPSWTQLKAATETAERLQRMIDERADLKREREPMRWFNARWEVQRREGLGYYTLASGDDLGEIESWLKNRNATTGAEA